MLTFVGPGTTSVTGVISDGGGATGTGSGAVALNGAGGTLTLSNANTYTGGTTVSHGTLAVASLGALGSGPLTMSGGFVGHSAKGTIGSGGRQLVVDTVNGGIELKKGGGI